MRFQKPETFEGLTLDEVNKLRREAATEATELNAIPDDKITAEQSADLIELVGIVGELGDHIEVLGQADAAAEQLAAARKAAAEIEIPDDASELVEADEAAKAAAAAEGADDVQPTDAEVEAAEKVLVAAGAAKINAFGARLAAQTAATPDKKAADDVDKVLASKALSMRAAANIPNFDSQQKIEDFTQLAEAYVQRSKAFSSRLPGGSAGRKALGAARGVGGTLSNSAERFSVAKLEKPANEFVINERMSAEDQYELFMRASSEKRLAGGSLTAAGGWCSPSEIVYGFLELESAEGLLNIAEIQAKRGGIQFTKGPQLGDLLVASDLNWIMTEAQAEAGTFTKPIYDIECPDWDEVRMDAVGYALRAGLLTDTTFPELLRRYLALALIVHARRMNALTISRISSLITQTMTLTSVGANPSATADLLDAIELGATRIREQYSMPLKSTVEAVFPIWVKMIVRSDLSRRNGDSGNLLSVTDQQIENWFKQRQISAQFVRDYQGINNGATTVAGGTAAWTTMPNKVEFMLYPAGSFVRLATPVIDLDTVYDTDNLTKNQFLAAFFEEGFGIANTGGSGVKVTVNLPNRFGATGYPAIGALANVAPTP